MLKLGVIGLSKGNGHPYSWSAICNGYDHAKMLSCGFGVIPQYLSERKWPEAKLPNGKHIFGPNQGMFLRVYPKPHSFLISLMTQEKC